ncbi:HlyD family efflux transporter periplasmic adaptor subunit [Muricauda sp. TY007]|uniref:HlyD family secretion protein n=1 Tax=Allomuricauda sp. TY007 TaxID=2683200 RepID=UPI0013BF9F56|nr:HlyD family efflux transporter periplasmic adaptor subunit [Muricauda sp. TY007]NDV17432.1 HlyD family efflux transporter periplasmic adaptor subunit [Muricauda sp. TY007]
MDFEENSTKHPFSPHINELIEKKPNWLIRCGIGGMLLLLLLFLVAAWLVKYPDVLVAKVTIVTPRPPIDILSKINAPIAKVFGHKENDTVSKNSPILLLESTTHYGQFLLLQETMGTIGAADKNDTRHWLDSLGSLQPAYNSFALARLRLEYYNRERPFDKRIESLKKIASGNTRGLRFVENYLGSSRKDFESKRTEFNRYKQLYDKGVISASEFEQVKQTLAQKEMGYANDHKALNSERLSIANLEREILELGLQQKEHEQQLQLAYQNTLNELKSQMEQWELQYLIKPPIKGKLSYFNNLNEGDFLASGERILTIIPLQQDKLQATGVLPSENAGKVKKGDKVVLKLDAYPYHEFGTVEGVVKRISEIPMENTYNIVIDLPQKLVTNYDNKIVFKQRLGATADIITKDQSLLQRVFYQFENLFRN